MGNTNIQRPPGTAQLIHGKLTPEEASVIANIP